VVFSSDHGENFGEGGVFFEHGDNAHDAGIRVPLAISGPGLAENRVDAGSVSLVDVMPTLLSLLAVPEEALPNMDGVDLASRLKKAGSPHGEDDRRVVFAESASTLRNQSYNNILTGRAGERACINGPRYTLCDMREGELIQPVLYDHIEDPGLSRDIASRHPGEVKRLQQVRKRWPPETARIRVAATTHFKVVQVPRLDGGYTDALYDRRSDPAEEHDVSSQYPEVARHLKTMLEAWAADIPLETPPPLDPAVTEALRSLGYISDPK
jgi:arylsulfatase A-like enzyme